jgi:hypothetical protein
MPPRGPVRSLFFGLRTFDHCFQDLTGQVIISYFPGSKFLYQIGAGASADVYQGKWQPEQVTLSECHW